MIFWMRWRDVTSLGFNDDGLAFKTLGKWPKITDNFKGGKYDSNFLHLASNLIGVPDFFLETTHPKKLMSSGTWEKEPGRPFF